MWVDLDHHDDLMSAITSSDGSSEPVLSNP